MRFHIACAIVLAAAVLALIAPASSIAAFTRPFLRQITRTEVKNGEGTSGITCSLETKPSELCITPTGLASDTSGNLWVINETEGIDEFGPTGLFLSSLELEGHSSFLPEAIAISNSTGLFYLTTVKEFGQHQIRAFNGAGKIVGESQIGEGATQVAVDNSTDPLDPSRESIYVTHTGTDSKPPFGDGLVNGIERLNTSFNLVEFSDAQKCSEVKCGYIEDDEIIGTPTGKFEFNSPRSIAVDGEGDIFVVGEIHDEMVVAEYRPSGEFVRVITGYETPGLEQRHEYDGFGGDPQGVAIDPVTGHILVSIVAPNESAVDEFDSSGRFLKQITETEIEVAGPPRVREASHMVLASGMTTNATGDLYVAEATQAKTEHAVDMYGPGVVLPSVRSTAATERHSRSAQLNGFVDPEGLELSDCKFEYVTEAAFRTTGFKDLESGGEAQCASPAALEISANTIEQAVHADVANLQVGTTYRYRLSASTSGPTGGTAESVPVAFATVGAPVVGTLSAEDISSRFADLHAEIDPSGAATSYVFEYSADGIHWSATPEMNIGSGGSGGDDLASVEAQIGPLTPSVSYRIRVVASSEGGSANLEGMFDTLPESEPYLPDGRAYELVTPANKGSASDMFANFEGENSNTGYASESGDEFLLTTTTASFGSSPASEHNGYLFSRDPGQGRWIATSLAPASANVQSIDDFVFDPSDFSQVGVNDFVGSDSSATGSRRTVFVGAPGGPYDELHADPPVHDTTPIEEEVGETLVVGGSHDLSRVVLESRDHTLAPGDAGQDEGSHALYEWAGGTFALVNVNGRGALLNECGAVLGGGEAPGARYNAVSADGTKVFFTAPDPYMESKPHESPARDCWNGEDQTENAPQVYMRDGEETVELSAPEKGVPGLTGGRHFAKYVGASANGAKVFFVTETELTEDSAGLHDTELYEYDTETAALSRISNGEPGSPVQQAGTVGAQVVDVPAVSADGTAVYFTARGRLTSGGYPQASGEEVYLYRYDTLAGKTSYVATVDERDYRSGTLSEWGPSKVALEPGSDWYTTPDGRYLLFATTEQLTKYSTAQAREGDCEGRYGLVSNGHCDEVYRYDSEDGSLACVSCDPSGASPISNAVFAEDAGSKTDPAAGPVRAMSDDGSYAFFDTGDPLVPTDTNGALDVYEWEAQGRGGCDLASGCVRLISSGLDAAPSFFLGYGPSEIETPSGKSACAQSPSLRCEIVEGGNVFIGTHANLIPSIDTASQGNIYDARICEPQNGNPCFKPPTTEITQCEGNACENPPSPPLDSTPGSMTFSGSGNATNGPPATSGSKSTAAQKLAVALRVCRKKPKHERAKCEKRAHSRYGSKSKGKKKTPGSAMARRKSSHHGSKERG